MPQRADRVPDLWVRDVRVKACGKSARAAAETSSPVNPTRSKVSTSVQRPSGRRRAACPSARVDRLRRAATCVLDEWSPPRWARARHGTEPGLRSPATHRFLDALLIGRSGASTTTLAARAAILRSELLGCFQRRDAFGLRRPFDRAHGESQRDAVALIITTVGDGV